MIHEQRSPILFDMDSPYLQKFRKLSTTSKDHNDNFRLESLLVPSENNKSFIKTESVKPHKIDSVVEQKQSPIIIPKLQKRYSQGRRKKAMFYREHSEPQQFERQNTNPQAQQSLNNQNFRKRLTSLEKYLQQTRSIQIPFRTRDRIYENEKFITELQGFQANLSQIKKKQSEMISNAMTQRINGKRNRLSQTRPKKLKIHDLENENVKKQKDKILVEKIMKQKLEDYRSKRISQSQDKPSRQQYFAKQLSMSLQIQNLNGQVQKMRSDLKRFKKLKKLNQEKLNQVYQFFGYLS